MKIALTGTPGTGKTSVAEHLEMPVIDLKHYMKENGIGEQKDELEVDIAELREKFSTDREDIVIEGHLSHHLDTDLCVVLRCDPEELEERLSERDYPEAKVEENLHAEALDIILQEAIAQGHDIIEVDTTGRQPESVADEVKRRVENKETGYGDLDFSSYLS